MSNATMTHDKPRGKGNLLTAGAIATVAAALGNLVVFYVAAAINGGPLTVPDPSGAGMMPAMVAVPVIFTAVMIIGATLVFALIKRRSAQPVRLFLIVSLVVLILSYLPFLLPIGLPTATVIAFALMHIVAAGIAVPILITMGR
jgi:hypothetical protein